MEAKYLNPREISLYSENGKLQFLFLEADSKIVSKSVQNCNSVSSKLSSAYLFSSEKCFKLPCDV